MAMSHETDLKAVRSENEEKYVANNFEGSIQPDQTVSFEKRVIVTTSRDYDTVDALDKATNDLMNKRPGGANIRPVSRRSSKCMGRTLGKIRHHN